MPSFALISEGLTDQIILERMIEQVCARVFEEDIFINPLQPLRDATDEAHAPHGGWELVLEYCGQSAADALAANDYIVVHLDTDEGDHPNFGVPLTHHGADRAYDALVSEVIDVIVGRIGAELYNGHSDRFLFAISVHSMESWILLYLFDVDEPKNSLDRLNRRMLKLNDPVIVKGARRYGEIARGLKGKKLADMGAGSHSLGLFISQLLSLAPEHPAATEA